MNREHMSPSDLPNLASGLQAASHVAHVAEVLHTHLGHGGHVYNLSLPASFDLPWDETPAEHQLALVATAGEVLTCHESHRGDPSPLDPAQLARVAALGFAAQVHASVATPVDSGVYVYDLLRMAHWLVEGGDPLKSYEDDVDNPDDEVGETDRVGSSGPLGVATEGDADLVTPSPVDDEDPSARPDHAW